MEDLSSKRYGAYAPGKGGVASQNPAQSASPPSMSATDIEVAAMRELALVEAAATHTVLAPSRLR